MFFGHLGSLERSLLSEGMLSAPASLSIVLAVTEVLSSMERTEVVRCVENQRGHDRKRKPVLLLLHSV